MGTSTAAMPFQGTAQAQARVSSQAGPHQAGPPLNYWTLSKAVWTQGGDGQKDACVSELATQATVPAPRRLLRK